MSFHDSLVEKLKAILKTEGDEIVKEALAATPKPNPAALKGQPGYVPNLSVYLDQLKAYEQLTHGGGKTTQMSKALGAFIMASPHISASDVFIVGKDAKIHKVGEANDLKIEFEMNTNHISEQIYEMAKIQMGAFSTKVGTKYAKSWLYGGIGNPMPPSAPITAPMEPPKLQHVFEALTEFAAKNPPKRVPEMKGQVVAESWFDELKSSLEKADSKYIKASPSFTFNGIDFPGEDIETVTQTTTTEGWPSFTLKLKPQAYDKWVQMLDSEHPKVPFKLEAP